MANRDAMTHQFSRVPEAEIPRSAFNRSHGYKTTLKSAGVLYPVFVDEALPGDTFNLRMTGFGRLATPLHPVMDNLYVESFFFAVPIRLVWANWQKFNGEQANPGDSTDFTVPTMTAPAGGHTEASMSDYFGIPTKIDGLVHHSLFHRSYNLIYNEWFRDQNMTDSVTVDMDDGPDDPADYPLRRRSKRHDYFTSCLPWPQKGPSVSLPLGTTAPVTGIGILSSDNTPGSATNNYKQSDETTESYTTPYAMSGTDAPTIRWRDVGGTKYPDIQADLASASAATINQLRQSFQIQKLYERDARGGTRYIEIIKAHFGVTSPDYRLQRPEYLGGGSSPININPVAQTSETNAAVTPQGNLAAFGTLNMNGHGFTKSFTEHCLLIGMVALRADLNYQQGLNRMFSRSTRWDFYWPALAHIGEQAVLNKEIYAQNDANDDLVFGYQERFAEYRYKPSVVTGQMRSNATTSLDTWHLAQDFSVLPALNNSFIVELPPVDRIIAVPSEPHALFDAWFDLKCVRPMPMHGVPGLIDHF